MKITAMRLWMDGCKKHNKINEKLNNECNFFLHFLDKNKKLFFVPSQELNRILQDIFLCADMYFAISEKSGGFPWFLLTKKNYFYIFLSSSCFP
jgi:hypothetical protein